MNNHIEGGHTRDEILLILEQGPAEVRFIKSDGTIREMKCTTKSDLITFYEKKTDRVKAINLEIIPVFDLEKNEWRSFKVDQVLSVSFVGTSE